MAGYPIDINALFVFNSNGKQIKEYQHIYHVRNTNFDNDGNYANSISNPCSSNPCKNGGTCNLGYNNTINCLCPYNYFGLFCINSFEIISANAMVTVGLQCQIACQNGGYCLYYTCVCPSGILRLYDDLKTINIFLIH